MSIKISVVVPIFNVKNYLKECVDSVLFQSVEPYEIILVDDGSTDGSEKICDNYSNEKLIKVVHKKNGGVSSARNIGIKEATGEYVCFIDADDYIEKNTFKNYNNILNKYGKADCIIDRMKSFSNSVRKISDFFIDSNFTNGKTGKEAFAITRRKCGRFDVGLRGIFKLSVIKNNEIYFDENLKSSEDIKWMLRIIENANNGILGSVEPNYCYRVGRENSLQNTFNLKRINDYITVYSEWNDYISKNINSKSDFIKELKKELGSRYIRLFSRTLRRVSKNDYIQAKKLIYDNSYLLNYCYPENKKTLYLFVLNKLFGKEKAMDLFIEHVNKHESK